MQYNFLYPVHNITTIHSAVPLSLLTAQHNAIQISVSSSQHYNYLLSAVPLSLLTAQPNAIQFFISNSPHYNYSLFAVPLSLLTAQHNALQFSVSSSQHYNYPLCCNIIIGRPNFKAFQHKHNYPCCLPLKEIGSSIKSCILMNDHITVMFVICRSVTRRL